MIELTVLYPLFNLAELVPLWEWVKGTLQTMSFLDATTSLESSQVRSKFSMLLDIRIALQ